MAFREGYFSSIASFGSRLPAYDGVDPNPLMWFFFILFYGMMMADMGYGLVMILIALLAIKKASFFIYSVRMAFKHTG